MCVFAESAQMNLQLEPRNDDELESTRIHQGQRGLQQMRRVKDLVTWNISVISPKTTLREADYVLSKLQVEVLAVYDGRIYQGFLTRSSVEELKKRLGTLQHTLAPEVMEQTMKPGALDEPVVEAYKRMRERGHTGLPVLDADGRLAGILTAETIEARFPNVELFSNYSCGNN